MIKNIKETSDYFFPELPRWISHFGFWLLLSLLVILLTASAFIRYSDKQVFRVIIERDAQYAEFSFAGYRKVKNSQKVMIEGPFDHAVPGYLEKRIIAARDSLVFIPVIIPDSVLRQFPLDGKIICQGEYETKKGSLLSNLVRAR